MSQSHFSCPVCDTSVQNDTIERCDKCKWVFGIDKELSHDLQCKLHEWARDYYELTVKLGQDEYDYKKLNSRFNRQRDEIENIKDDINKFNKSFPLLLSNIEEIKFILTTNDRALNENSQEFEAKEVEDNIIEQEKLLKDKFFLTAQELTQAPQNIISDYYHNPREFAVKYQAKIANITKNSIANNRGSEDKVVILEEANKGNYWIFDFEDRTYLVPVEDKYINQHSYTTSSTIFEGHNYTSNYQKIQLVKPAIVSIEPNTNPQTWRLQQQGELVFL